MNPTVYIVGRSSLEITRQRGSYVLNNNKLEEVGLAIKVLVPNVPFCILYQAALYDNIT